MVTLIIINITIKLYQIIRLIINRIKQYKIMRRVVKNKFPLTSSKKLPFYENILGFYLNQNNTCFGDLYKT